MKILLVGKLVLMFLFLSTNMLFAQHTTGRSSGQLSTLVPQPLNVKPGSGTFRITSATRIVLDEDNNQLRAIAEKLNQGIRRNAGFAMKVATGQTARNTITLRLGNVPDSLGKEGYSLDINRDNIAITANTPAGIFYGTQTLLQLMPVNKTAASEILIPQVQITDRPRFEWRGLMLDVGRYFYPIDFLKRYIDYMAMHKLNTFHWHLTEDHGWRIEIKKFPRLTEIGAVRAGTQFDHGKHQVKNSPHWGYYTQDQIRELVAYAAERFVTIVPEVEMPGHTLAALVAYPELSCSGGPLNMPLHWAIQKDIYCAGNEQTFNFLQDVLTELADLFPGSFIHIGGDEAPKDRWKACAKCQQRIKDEGLKNESELQSYFIKRIERFLQTKNKRIIGWDEILEGGLAPNAAVMSWRGIKGGIEAAQQKHDVVMTPTDFMYFDYYQGEPYLEPVAIGGLLTLEKVYSYEPVPSELSEQERSYIKGVQGNVWSEFIHAPEKVEYMTFPRAAALAEVAWTLPQYKNWNDFKRRMESQYARYEKAGINYSASAYNVWPTVDIDSTAKKAKVSFTSASHDPQIRYTTDGSAPTSASPLYSKPFEIKMPATIKAAVFNGTNQKGKVSERSIAIVPEVPLR
jgi:hexosaminidase